MITPTNVLIEFPLGSPVSEITQVLHHIEEWEDFAVDTHCMMGDRKYILKVCQDQLDYEEQKKQMQLVPPPTICYTNWHPMWGAA